MAWKEWEREQGKGGEGGGDSVLRGVFEKHGMGGMPMLCPEGAGSLGMEGTGKMPLMPVPPPRLTAQYSIPVALPKGCL